MRRRHLARRLVRLMEATRTGFTYDVRSGDMATFNRDEFAVSVAGFTRCATRIPSVVEVTVWLARTWPVVRLRGCYVGYWRDHPRGWHYLDVTVIVRGLESALARAQAERQCYIDDGANDRCVPVPQPVRPAA